MVFVYMIKNSANKLYVGVTNNPEKRLATHNSCRGAQFTASTSFHKTQDKSLSTSKPDFKIVFLEEYQNLTEARQREIQIKKWRRDKKEFLTGRYKRGLSTKLNS